MERPITKAQLKRTKRTVRRAEKQLKNALRTSRTLQRQLDALGITHCTVSVSGLKNDGDFYQYPLEYVFDRLEDYLQDAR